MPTLLLALVAGCTSGVQGPSTPTPAAMPDGSFPEVDMADAGSVRPAQLYLPRWRAEATWELASSNLPPDLEAPRRLEIELDPRRGRRPAIIDLPFALDDDALAEIGRDLTVTVAGRALRYASLGGGAWSWRVKRGKLVIQVPPNQSSAMLEYRGAAELVKRRSLDRSGLAPADFVADDLTLGGHTRPGLVLPSPSKGTWTLDLPENGARFEAFTALLPPPFTDLSSDGMRVVLEVTEGGDTAEVGSRDLKSAEGFDRWEVDLSSYGGKTVDLSLRTEVTGSSDFDYAFLGTPTVWGDPTHDVRRVLVIGMDTTRPDHFSWYGYPRKTTPELDAVANESAVLTSAWTPAPRTRPSFRSATTGRNPLDAVGATNIGAVFQANGFATAGIVANIHLQPRFDFHEGFDSWRYFPAPKANADVQVDRALEWFGAHEDRDTYMFLHFMDPHLRYGAPAELRDQFVEDPDPDLPRTFDRGDVIRWARDGSLDERRKEHIRALYDGELRFTSREIGRLIEGLDALDGDTLVVIHSDHGEEFWEHGGYEHNHTLYGEVTDAVLWFRPPGGTEGGPVRVDHPATLADIAPTLYDFMDFEELPPTDGISLRPWMEGRETGSRDIGVAHLRYGLDRWAVIHAGHKYIVATGTGDEELYDLRGDAAELENLAGTTDLTAWREALAPAHPGMQAGMGWRIEVGMRGNGPPLTFTLPAPVADAAILDPEALLANGRANKAWGEPPRKTPEEVGAVALAEDGVTLTFTPGSKPDGVIWVLFDGAPPGVSGTGFEIGGNAADLPVTAGEAEYVGATGTRVKIRPGMIVVPPPDEAARMAALEGDGPGERDDSTTCQLCRLGYIVGEACTECEDAP